MLHGPCRGARVTDLEHLSPPVDEFEAERVQRKLRADLFGVQTPARRVDRFVILDRIGAGAMGAVYAAFDPRLDRKVAIKFLHKTITPDDDANARLMREARALARLDHPNVVTVHEVGTFEDRIFVAMEFVDGCTLKTWLEEKHPLAETLALFVEAGRGLAAAHSAGLVHRDFKPDNVLVADVGSARGRARVADFGLVQSTGEASPEPTQLESEPGFMTRTRTGAVVGTLAYMAPEQHRGEAVTPASDQFAFCVALYEAVTGTRPFEEESRLGLLEAIEHNRFASRERTQRIPVRLRKAILRGLAPDPEQRWPDMHTLVADLGRDHKWKSRLGVALGVAAVAGVGVWSSVDRVDPCTAPRQALARTYNDNVATALVETISALPAPAAAEIASALRTKVDDYVAAWWIEREAVCDAAAAGDEAAQRSAVCLDAELSGLGTLLDILTTPGRETVQDILSLIPEAEELRRCATVAAVAEVRPDATVTTLLAQAKTTRSAGNEALAREFIDQALARAESLENPASQAQTLVFLSRAEMRRKRSAEALVLLDRAAPLAELAGSDVIRTDGLKARVEALIRLGRTTEANQVLVLAQAAVDRFRSHPVFWDVELDVMRGDLAVDSEQPDVALAHYRRGLQRVERGAVAPLVHIILLSRISGVFYAKRDFEATLRAEEHVRTAIESAYGDFHPGLATSWSTTGAALFYLQRRTEAKVALQRALELRERVVERPDDPSLAGMLTNLGGVFVADEPERAEALFRRARRATIAGVGETHPNVVKIDVNLAVLLEQAGRLDDAESHTRAAIEHAVTILSRDDPGVLKLRGVQGSVLLALGRTAAARESFEAVLRAHQEGGRSSESYLIRPVCGLARLLADQQLDRAEELSTRCAKLVESATSARWWYQHAAVSLAVGRRTGTATAELDSLAAELREGLAYAGVPSHIKRWFESELQDAGYIIN